MTLPKAVANAFHMTDEVWRRHANPWSVFTRFAAIPAMALAIWSRVWLGWWALLPVALVILWLWLNPRVFRPVSVPTSWAAKGIFGEKLWLTQPASVPDSFRVVLRGLMALGATGFGFVAWGLVFLQVWPTVFGRTPPILLPCRMAWSSAGGSGSPGPTVSEASCSSAKVAS